MSPSKTPAPALLALVALLFLATRAPSSWAASTDIYSEPVITKQSVSAKPNIMFILDDSGSMGSSYMPDDMYDSSAYGYWSPQCNGLAFDPAIEYPPPVSSAGVAYANASFTAALNDGYASGAGSVDLTNSYYYAYATTGTLQPRMSWTYNSSGQVDTATTFAKECLSSINSAPGNVKFTKVLLSGASASDKQKYANYFSYYSRRYLLMRTAVGKAVQALDSGYRVGFSRINSTSITDGADFRDAKPFDATQKANFYGSFYGVSPGGGTPLRGALSKIGRYFAKKLPGQTYDPIEYACQRNYAILTTDGYWNLGGSPGVAESSSYGPLDLSGASVGNQDPSEVRPMFDGANSNKTSVTPSTTVTITKTDTSVKTTTTSKQNKVVVTSCGGTKTVTSTTPQTRTQSFITNATTYSQQTSTTTRSVVVTDGVLTSDTTSAPSTTTATPSSPAPVSAMSGATDSGFVDGKTVTGKCVNGGTVGTTFTNMTSSTASQNQMAPATSTVSVTGPTVGATTTTTSFSAGSSNTLSDVAEYYYMTDLRNASLGNCASKDSANVVTDVCTDIVPTGGRDTNKAQHMTTYAIGLGVSGTLGYDPGYLAAGKSADFDAVSGLVSPVKNWPPTTTAISGYSGDARNIDDLWHAAVNGRGQYFSALTATGLSNAIAGVVSAIKQVTGSGAAASFNTLALVPGDSNRVYQGGYTTSIWAGDVSAYPVDGVSGAIAATPVWSAQAKLASKTAASRTIYYRQAPATSVLRAFTYANLNADGYAANFASLCSKTLVASQCAGLSAGNLTIANDPSNLINYLRGDGTYETSNTTTPLYRDRTPAEGRKVLGDIISGAPVYAGKPPFLYTDAGYASYAAANASRTPMVYAGANDGMLHAFSAATGDELWAYVPTELMSNMYKLANSSYANNHQYFVDGEPVVGDIYVGGAWKTILVGGLGAGGKSYYALDVTVPESPVTLWEFTDANLGLSYGNPVITKRADGTWVVAFASGYNNTAGDGKGHLYVVNANSGAKLLDISTPAGSAGSPSGLAKINPWIDKATTNNTATRFYGGDLLGNLWRFDIDNLVAPNRAALLMAQLQTSSGAAQPITVRPEPLLISGTIPAVAVGTGRFLGTSDISDTTQQGLYVLKDNLTGTGLGVIRNNTSVVKHTVTVTSTNATITTEGVNWDTQNGWWFDMPQSGERIVTTMGLFGPTLTVASVIPSGDACTSGGTSWLYRINFTSGLPNTGDTLLGQLYSTTAVIVGLTVVTASDGTTQLFVKDSLGNMTRQSLPPASPPGSGDPRRSSWRELLN